MSVRRLILAVQFLTRLPTPQIREFDPKDLTRAAIWFPLVGALIGTLLLVPVWSLQWHPWLAAVLALLLWVWVTGALHLDGLGDVADALGAAHRDPQRFLEVLKDPRMGVFGVVTLVMQLLLKLVLLQELIGARWWPGLLLIPAWARWGALWWSRRLQPLQPGMAERFAWQLQMRDVWLWAAVLAILSTWLAPPLLLALLLVPAIAVYWRRRLGGISGDCLGASIEACETLLLLALVLTRVALPPGGPLTSA